MRIALCAGRIRCGTLRMGPWLAWIAFRLPGNRQRRHGATANFARGVRLRYPNWPDGERLGETIKVWRVQTRGWSFENPEDLLHIPWYGLRPPRLLGFAGLRIHRQRAQYEESGRPSPSVAEGESSNVTQPRTSPTPRTGGRGSEAHRDRLFFTDVGGFKFMIAPEVDAVRVPHGDRSYRARQEHPVVSQAELSPRRVAPSSCSRVGRDF